MEVAKDKAQDTNLIPVWYSAVLVKDSLATSEFELLFKYERDF